MKRLAWVFLWACHTPALPPPSSGEITIVSVSAVATGSDATITWKSSVAGSYLVVLDSGVVAARGQVTAGSENQTTVLGGALSNGDNPGVVSVFPSRSQSLFARFTVNVSTTGSTTGTATLAFDASAYDYGHQLTGTATPKTLTLTNNGTGAAIFATASDATLGLSAPFALSAGTCTQSLAANASCTLIVNYAPSASGTAGETLTFGYNDGNQTTSISTTLAGTASAPCDSVGANPSLSALGSGLPADPYILCNAEQLMSLTKTSSAWSASYLVGQDIDLVDHTAGSIAPYYAIGALEPYFTGRFDGGGHVIHNLSINSIAGTQGLFGQLAFADVRNVTVDSPNVTADHEVGAIAGSADQSTLFNNHATGTGLISGDNKVGGLYGDAGGSIISSSSSSVSVQGNNTVGGLVGCPDGMDSLLAYNSYATGDVTGGKIVGGFIGEMDGGGIFECYASGNVTADSDSVGGFVGFMPGNGTPSIQRSFAYGTVNVDDTAGTTTLVGRFVGHQAGGDVGSSTAYNGTPCTNTNDSCHNAGENEDGASSDFEKLTASGPHAGWDFSNTWQDNSASGQLPTLRPVTYFDETSWGGCAAHAKDSPFAGGTGSPEAPYLICTATQLVTLADNLVVNSERWNGLNYKLMDNLDMSTVDPSDIAEVFPIGATSGFLGRFDGNGKTIDKLTVTGFTTTPVGLFATFSGIITRLGVTNATISGASSLCPVSYCVNGGILAGQFYGTVINSYVTGTLTADNAGGLVGLAPQTFIFNSYAIVPVNGYVYAGGIAGETYSLDVHPVACFSVGAVTVDPVHGQGSAAAGYIAPNSGADKDSFFDSGAACPNDCDSSGTGVNVSLQSDYFFSPLNPPMLNPGVSAPWDFVNVWQSGASYPTLR